MRGQKRVEDARERAYDPRIHLLREKFLRRRMDCRVKPGNDNVDGHARSFILPRFARPAPCSERNPQLQETTAGAISLLRDCYLQ
jgi:hypothetical protein